MSRAYRRIVAAGLVLGAGTASCGSCAGEKSSPLATPALASSALDVDAASACGVSGPRHGLESRALLVGGEKRTYSVFVPDGYDGKTPLPMVVAFHGDGGDGLGMRGIESGAGKAVFVYPDGPNRTWDLETPPAKNSDYVYFDSLLADVSANYCVDRHRVMLFGFSRGGFFVNQLACFRPNAMRAIVSHSGGGPYSNERSDFDFEGYFSACVGTPPAAMIVHGEADGVVPPIAGRKAARHFQHFDKCSTESTATAPSPCIRYSGCLSGHPVMYCALPGVGHQVWEKAVPAAWSFFESL